MRRVRFEPTPRIGPADGDGRQGARPPRKRWPTATVALSAILTLGAHADDTGAPSSVASSERPAPSVEIPAEFDLAATLTRLARPRATVEIERADGRRIRSHLYDASALPERQLGCIINEHQRLRLETLVAGRETTADGVQSEDTLASQVSVAGQYVVTMAATLDDAHARARLGALGVEVVRRIGQRPIYLVEVADDRDSPAQASSVERLRKAEGVIAVDPEFILESTAGDLESDGTAPAQWHLDAVRARDAWKLADCSSRPLVAVIDTAMRLSHPDLKDNIWSNPGESGANATDGDDNDGNGFDDDEHGWDFVDWDNDVAELGKTTNERQHGTRVAGIIAASGSVPGVCPGARILPLRAVCEDREGVTALTTISRLLDALDYIINLCVISGECARVINISAVHKCIKELECPPASEVTLIREAAAHSMLVVAAAGQDRCCRDIDKPCCRRYPAGLDEPNLIAVAATRNDDHLWGSSNYGKTLVALGAPGVDIYSPSDSMDGNLYGVQSGTSFATPMVAGAALILLDRCPLLDATAIKTHIVTNAFPVPALRDKVVSGGRLDLFATLQACPPAR